MAMDVWPYQLALLDLEQNTNPEVFEYIKSVFVGEERECKAGVTLLDGRPSPVNLEESGKTKRISLTESLGWNNRRSPIKSPLDSVEGRRGGRGRYEEDDGSGNGTTATVEKDRRSWKQQSVYSSSLTRSQRGTLSTTLCSHLPLCRKIFYKYEFRESLPPLPPPPPPPRGSRKTGGDENVADADEGGDDDASSWNNNDGGTTTPSLLLDVPLNEIVGKINVEEPPEFERGRKLVRAPGGVREFRSSVSNPLYKNYNPRGHIKTEDELAREFIQHITQSFNERMRNSFEGEPIQLDPAEMIRILRDDLEKPG